tara:strand:- start:141 stop:332 length:192 start_codon:yes stop_codon:yes gene_type:complete
LLLLFYFKKLLVFVSYKDSKMIADLKEQLFHKPIEFLTKNDFLDQKREKTEIVLDCLSIVYKC